MGNGYAIIGDVTCDLNEELRQRFGLDNYMMGHITKPDGTEVRSKLEWDFTTPKEFYSAIKSNKDTYKTASASVEEMVECWGGYLAEGKDVLALTISSTLSVTYNLMLNAQKKLQEKYPERKVFVIDSRKYSSALGLLTIKACQLREQGLTIEENAAKLEEMKNEIHQMGTMDDLFFVASKGRLSHSKAFMGTLVGVKPMGDFNSDGMVTVLAKVKGYEKAYKVILEYLAKTIKDAEGQIVMVAHSMREEQAKTLAKLIEERIHPKEVVISDIYPPCGINVGPGLLAAYYFGDPITDLARETEIMKNILGNRD